MSINIYISVKLRREPRVCTLVLFIGSTVHGVIGSVVYGVIGSVVHVKYGVIGSVVYGVIGTNVK